MSKYYTHGTTLTAVGNVQRVLHPQNADVLVGKQDFHEKQLENQ